MEESEGREIYHLTRLNMLYRLQMQRIISDLGIYFGQHMILIFLNIKEGCTQRELADSLRISPPSVATSIKRMQRSGLIIKESDDNDLRRTHLFLTDKGREILSKGKVKINSLNERMLSGISGDRRAELHRLLAEMMENLEDKDIQADELYCILQSEKMIKKDFGSGGEKW